MNLANLPETDFIGNGTQTGCLLDNEEDCRPEETGKMVGIISGKDKSPMCLVNELCRFNAITCLYELVEESGAPHARIFSVLLKLGDKEEYSASAPSIRKAQHAAASLALGSTKYSQPSSKLERKVNRSSSQLTPTVELNVLAMKRREQVQYRVYEQPVRTNLQPNSSAYHPTIANQLNSTNGLPDLRHLYQPRLQLARGMTNPWYVATVTVGDRQFTGRGKTVQAARHAAAEEAMKTLRNLPITIEATHSNETASLADAEDEADESKSPVSMIYEAAMKRAYTVDFKVTSESGPSHMPCFVVLCMVGPYSAEGKGVRKKTAKRRAASAVLMEMEAKEPIVESTSESNPGLESEKLHSQESTVKRTNRRTGKKKKDSKNVDELAENLKNVSLSSGDPHSDEREENSSAMKLRITDEIPTSSNTLNPISRLIQLQMAKREPEPKFTFISEKELAYRRKEFTIQCSIAVLRSARYMNLPLTNNELITLGVGANKKLAKRNAALEMLKILGYSSGPEQSTTPRTTFMTVANPILKPATSSAILNESIPVPNNCSDQLPTTDCLEPIKTELTKEKRVKFMVDPVDSKGDLSNLHEQLENLPELSQEQKSLQKYGRQIAPGLLLVMRMNQTSNPIDITDNNSIDDTVTAE